ncbi:hypothetical protein MRB53_041191 [Persea americana]|nr:hypothetical protein MRB53_041191 [Persea americana]
MSILFYRRPDYVEKAPGYLNESDCQKYVERTQCARRDIPEELAFDRILRNETLPPCALGDFMDYLVYVAHDAENLQFYLWFEDYSRRLEALPESSKALSRPWVGSRITGHMSAGHDEQTRSGCEHSDSSGEDDVGATTKAGLEAPSLASGSHHASTYPPRLKPDEEDFHNYITSTTPPTRSHRSTFSTAASTTTATINATNAGAGLSWSGFDVQPFRPEINRVISHYIAVGAPRQLNLSPESRGVILHALQHTTHPSAFPTAMDLVETSLRHRSHPNFVRWSICNGNKPRVFYVRAQGVEMTFVGFVIAILLTLSHANRWWRLFAAIPWFIGITTLIAAYKGLCVLLHLGHNRGLKPWQDPQALYSTFTGKDSSSDVASRILSTEHGSPHPVAGPQNMATIDMEKATYTFSPSPEAGRDIYTNPKTTTIKDEINAHPTHTTNTTTAVPPQTSLDPFGADNASYATRESWPERYAAKSRLRKIFDATTYVEEAAIRVLQDCIVRQSQFWAVVGTVALCGLFVPLPRGNLY